LNSLSRQLVQDKGEEFADLFKFRFRRHRWDLH
jgi:hypothetical protein